MVAVCAINVFGVRWFGEAEFVFAIIKSGLTPSLYVVWVYGLMRLCCGVVCMITGLILLGLIIDLGGGPDHQRIGFRVSYHSPIPFRYDLSMVK
jgi:yeast amino acid transporter